jgi:hypothetical protein
MDRDQLRVLDPPAAVELLDDQLGVEEQLDLSRTQLLRKGERAQDGRVLGYVVRLDSKVLRDGGDGRGVGAARPGRGGIDQDGSQ